MSVLLAILGLVLGGGLAIALAIAGRWAAALPFGERSFREAYGGRRPGAPPPRQSPGLAFARALGGIAGWYLASSLLVGCAFFAGGEPRTDDQSMRITVGLGGPAAAAGLRDGDRILAVDGTAVHGWDELRHAVASRAGERVRVDVERDGHELTVDVTPVGTPPKIMVGPPSTNAPVGIGRAAALGAVTPGKLLVTTAQAFGRMFTGGERAEVSGPVGIVKETAKAEREGLATAARLVSLLVSYFLVYVVVISLGVAIASTRRRRTST